MGWIETSGFMGMHRHYFQMIDGAKTEMELIRSEWVEKGDEK